jgi:hypothetical protein
MTTDTSLRGRHEELGTLERLLDAVRAGESRALVLRGEPGIGKTALLEHAVLSASEFRVARAVGIESEMELAFAALQQLCAPMLDRLEQLRLRSAMRSGWRSGSVPDIRRTVSLLASRRSASYRRSPRSSRFCA